MRTKHQPPKKTAKPRPLWRRQRPGRLSIVGVAAAAAVAPIAGFLHPGAASATLSPAPPAPAVSGPGDVAAFGSAAGLGGPGASIAAPIVAMASTPSGKGYWLVGSDGGVFSYGDAAFYGSTGGQRLASGIVGIASTPSGHGYWLVAGDGGIFSFGDAAFFGSLGGQHLQAPVVGIAATPSGHGYWMVASDGGVFTFGDAGYLGSLGGQHLQAPVVGIAATPSGHGYWMVASDGGVFTFGDAPFRGSIAGATPAPAVSVAGSAAGDGYWIVTGIRAPAPQDLGVFTVTCYSLTGSTATGAPTSQNVVAVDPTVVPLGTTVTIDGVGVRVASDTGGAIKGHRLDIWEPSATDCALFGVRQLEVWRQAA